MCPQCCSDGHLFTPQAAFHGPVWQRDFLAHMGIVPRFEALLQQASEEQASNLKKGLVRLMDTEEGMGKLFKAAAIVPQKYGSPAGF
jgi:SAM-dependent MidA family methyltransferase